MSAEHGFDIPAGINPIVQTHQKEMILPAEHADTIRSLRGNQGNQTEKGMRNMLTTTMNRHAKQISRNMGRTAGRFV